MKKLNLLVFKINIESESFPLSDLEHSLVVESGGMYDRVSSM